MSKFRIFCTLLMISISGSAMSQTQDLYFTSAPALSPDGKTIVFSYQGDLWQVKASGGMALRLTAMDGDETRAKYSPDGQWIAFTSSQYGNEDVYIIPSGGGEIRQLTYHDGADMVDNWSWDSETIYFTSSRMGRFSGYSVNKDGGTPKRLFDNYFHTVHDLTEHPDGELFFDESWESINQAYRKGYKGAYNPEIQSWNAATGEYKKYTDYEGKDMWPTIDRNGNIYFVSDENNGQYNLYTFENGTKKALTEFDTSIKYPVVNANGGLIVFEKDFQTYTYNTANKKITAIPIKAYTNTPIGQNEDFNVKGKVTYFDVSGDGKKLAFTSRGELFVSDIKGKFVQKIPTDPLGRVFEVKWLKDNNSLLYNQTSESGFSNLYTIKADGSSKERQLTSDSQNNRDITLNNDRSKGVYLSGRNELRIIDLNSFESKKIVEDEFWGFQNSPPMFSPNDEYVLFTSRRNFEEDIMIHNIESNQTTNLTQTGITERAPYWSPDGKYIYFTSNRFSPGYPFGLRDAHVYRVSVDKFSDEYKSDEYKKLFASSEVDTDKKDEPKTPKKITVNAEDFILRAEQVSPDFGTQGSSQVIQKDGKTHVIYSSNHGEGNFNLWITTYEPFEKPKTEKIDGASTYNTFIVEADGKFYSWSDGDIYTLNPDSKKIDKINIGHTFRKNMKDEFTQMFSETWANVKENFYNETFHGLDWDAKKEYYGAFLPYIRSRADLRALITEMLGDLNSSHLGFRSSGDEEDTYYEVNTIATGIEFAKENPFVVERIIEHSNADKSDLDIRAGDVLMMVNNQPVDQSQNREQYFLKPSLDEEVMLTLKRGSSNHEVKLKPQSSRSINALAYDEWIESNQKMVDEKSNKRIAYAYMKNMGQGELEKFLIDMTSEAYRRDALILDLRYNTGGNVHDKVLQFLSQKPYLQWKYREGALTVQPNFTPGGKPLVLLINEQSLSDAEMTAAGFKELGLGKIIGTETYRWIIFTSGKGLVDGSFYRLPAWGCYTLDGKNLEKTGVSPDIYVPMNFKDRLENRDPQLERAIDEILKDLE